MLTAPEFLYEIPDNMQSGGRHVTAKSVLRNFQTGTMKANVATTAALPQMCWWVDGRLV